MERLFKVENVFSTSFKGKKEGDPDRPKVEITLTYYETGTSQQNGPFVRKQSVVVSLIDDAARNCPFKVGQWLVACISFLKYDSQREPGRQSMQAYLDRYVVVDNVNQL